MSDSPPSVEKLIEEARKWKSGLARDRWPVTADLITRLADALTRLQSERDKAREGALEEAARIADASAVLINSNVGTPCRDWRVRTAQRIAQDIRALSNPPPATGSGTAGGEGMSTEPPRHG